MYLVVFSLNLCNFTIAANDMKIWVYVEYSDHNDFEGLWRIISAKNAERTSATTICIILIGTLSYQCPMK